MIDTLTHLAVGTLAVGALIVYFYVSGWIGNQLTEEWTEDFWETVGSGVLYNLIMFVAICLTLILGYLIMG